MSKSKSPAFSFYPADYLSDTQHMTPAEQGAYMRLLATGWRGIAGLPQCFLPTDDGRLARIVGMTDPEWREARSAVLELFQIDEEKGAYCHGRLLRELARQNERSATARSSAERRWGGKPEASDAADAKAEAQPREREGSKASRRPAATSFRSAVAPKPRALATVRQGYAPSTGAEGQADLVAARQRAIATVRAYACIHREAKAAALFDLRQAGSVAEVDACLQAARQIELRAQVEARSKQEAPSES